MSTSKDRTRRASEARESQGLATESAVMNVIRGKPGISVYQISRILGSSIGLVDGAVKRLSDRDDVDTRQVLREGRITNEVYPKDYRIRPSPEIEVGSDMFPPRLNWGEKAYIYALNRASIGISSTPQEEWSKKALLEAEGGVKKKDTNLVITIPEKLRNFYLWENSSRNVSVVDDLILVDLKTEIPIVGVAEPNSPFLIKEATGPQKNMASIYNSAQAVVTEERESEAIAVIMRASRPQVSIIGIGGAGTNIISWVKEKLGGVTGAKLIAVNTDATHLSTIKADRRILLGQKTTSGMGAGGYPQRGEQAATESLEQIKNDTEGSNVIFIVTGLGGGTGTGASWVIANALKPTGALMIGVVTLPFAVERFRYINAHEGLRRLRQICDTVIVIDNNRLAKLGNLSLKASLGMANELVGEFLKSVVETMTTESLVNIDFADFRAITEKRGLAGIGVADATDKNRIERATLEALDNQLLDIKDSTNVFGVLVQITAGEDLTLDEVIRAEESVTKSLPVKARVIWGARVQRSLKGSVSAMVVLTGIESAFLTDSPRKVIHTQNRRDKVNLR
ncbi:MAG: cell division protein FtsZ [Nitrososphaerales archaeon]